MHAGLTELVCWLVHPVFRSLLASFESFHRVFPEQLHLECTLTSQVAASTEIAVNPPSIDANRASVRDQIEARLAETMIVIVW